MTTLEEMENWIEDNSNSQPIQELMKKMPEDAKIALIQETYDKYGVRSNQFFKLIKQLITWTANRYTKGMHFSNTDDLINNAYEELIIAFEGGNTTHYNKPVYKPPIYGTPRYYKKFKNIGAFIMYVVGSSVSKYRAKNFRKQILHENFEMDISDRLNYLDFEMDNNLDYSIDDPIIEPVFHQFKLNKAFTKHIQAIKETHPRNNVLYNFMLWKEKV